MNLVCERTAAAYGRCLGAAPTRRVMLEWLFSVAFSWLATEPLLILLLILAPFAFGNLGKWSLCAGCAVWMQAVGMDPAFLSELIF